MTLIVLAFSYLLLILEELRGWTFKWANYSPYIRHTMGEGLTLEERKIVSSLMEV